MQVAKIEQNDKVWRHAWPIQITSEDAPKRQITNHPFCICFIKIESFNIIIYAYV